MLIFIFLSSGLFLGWSLGANDAANVFGTAVGAKMVQFKTAAVICSIFLILGSSISGAGAAHTLGKLGAVNQISGAFMVALAAALTVSWMTRLHLPVSTSQAIVGAIIGWNFFSGSLTDYRSLTKILSTWILCPVLAGLFSIVLYRLLIFLLRYYRVHFLQWDHYNRVGLILVGAFGSYSLGANNIANVMGVFVPVSPFSPLDLKIFTMTSTEQLFFLGGIAIAVGVFTYSYKVMTTVGTKIVKLTPESALVVVLSSSLVLFLFASQGLESLLAARGLPTIPLVPVSSSQAVVGAVIGIGLSQGGRGINYKVLGSIASGWVTTPIIAGLVSFTALFFLQNVFNQHVYTPEPYVVSPEVLEKLIEKDIADLRSSPHKGLDKILDIEYKNASLFKTTLEELSPAVPPEDIPKIIEYAKIQTLRIDIEKVKKELGSGWLSKKKLEALLSENETIYTHYWQFYDTLSGLSPVWKYKPDTIENKKYNKELENKLKYLFRKFRIDQEE
ncbi:MAG: inorganic phosphate transporter [bacterium]|nr:inorganic phosphate transporter [bacterium]